MQPPFAIKSIPDCCDASPDLIQNGALIVIAFALKLVTKPVTEPGFIASITIPATMISIIHKYHFIVCTPLNY